MDGILPGYPAPSSEGTRPRPLLADRPNLEARWVLAAQAGYTLAFDELVARNQDRIYRLAANITGNPSDAEDAVRATFIKAREHLQAIRIESRFSAWLCRIGAIEALLRLRGRYPRQAALDHCAETERELMRNEFPYCADNPYEHDTQAELKRLATANTNILKPICRIIFFLCDVENWSVGKTADFLGLPVSAVTASLPRTRQEISEHLNRHTRELNCLLPRCLHLLEGAQRRSIMREQLVAQQHEAAIPVQLLTGDILHKRKTELDLMIARRAFELFEARGGSHGHDVDDWITAELELLRPYRHDLKESAEAVVFHAELPCSFTPDQLNVSVEPRRLTISGERELEVTCVGDVPTHVEKRTERIFQMEELPVDVDPSWATATLKGEVLEITMPKVIAVGASRAKTQAAFSGR